MAFTPFNKFSPAPGAPVSSVNLHPSQMASQQSKSPVAVRALHWLTRPVKQNAARLSAPLGIHLCNTVPAL